METEIQIYSIISLLSYDKYLIFKYAWSRIACYISLLSHTKCLDATFTSVISKGRYLAKITVNFQLM